MSIFSKRKSGEELPRRRQYTEESKSDVGGRDQYAFKRNRTLVGSASPHVASTGEPSSAELRSPRSHTHELTKQRRRISGVLSLVLAISAVLFLLISNFTAGVDVKQQHDSTTHLDPVYEETIQSYLSTQPIERLRFFTNIDHLNSYIQSKIPEVATVSVKGSSGFGRTTFTLTMRQPIAGWSMNSKQQYVDAVGVSFSRNYFAQPTVQIVDNSGIRVQAGQAVASGRFLSFVGRTVGAAKAQGYNVSQVVIPRDTTRQIELRLNGVGYPVKLSIDRSVGEQVEDMARSLKWLSGHGISPHYLDVRVSGRAFYQQ